MTPGDTSAKHRRARFVTTEMGEAMAPAPGTPASGGNRSGAGAALIGAVLAACAVIACGDDARPPAPPPAVAAPDRDVADPARGVTTELDGAAPELRAAAFAELSGDLAAAHAGFEQVLAAPDAPPALSARAALRLARLESRAGKTRHALELAARASALAPGDAAIAEGVAGLQADMVAAAGTGDVRGPRLGTTLPGVAPRDAAAFAAAERALATVHSLRSPPVVETLSSSIRVREAATEDAVARYRGVAEAGGLAQIAASYRAGSLYHDLALGLLLFELPPELDAAVAAGLHRTLRSRAIAYLKKAAAEYRAALAAPKHPEDELWRLAAETDLRGARDLLGEAGEK